MKTEVFKDGDKFYYRGDNTTIEITEEEFHKVKVNPSLYYFSTALKLHLKVNNNEA
jgi:hypothetical protein